MTDATPSASTDGDGDVQTVLDRLETIETNLEGLAEPDDPEVNRRQEEVRETKRMLEGLAASEFVSETIRKYTARDVAEGFVGAIVFAIPLLVEDGVNVIAAHFLETSVAGVPVYMTANLVFIVALTSGVIYGADFRQVQVNRPLFGFLPRRLIGVLAVSFLTAAGLMVLWGRFEAVGGPLEAVSRISVVWTVAALGASLGDILPGESVGEDINDVVDDLA